MFKLYSTHLNRVKTHRSSVCFVDGQWSFETSRIYKDKLKKIGIENHVEFPKEHVQMYVQQWNSFDPQMCHQRHLISSNLLELVLCECLGHCINQHEAKLKHQHSTSLSNIHWKLQTSKCYICSRLHLCRWEQGNSITKCAYPCGCTALQSRFVTTRLERRKFWLSLL